MFNKAIEILYLAEICNYMKTPHSCHDLGPTLDTELNVNKYVRMLNDIDTQQDSQSWASLTNCSVASLSCTDTFWCPTYGYTKSILYC